MLLDLKMPEVTIRTDELIIKSEILNREVACVFYMPQLEAASEPLHLLLLNDGQDLETMQYEQILQALYKKNSIKPVLTVGIKAGNRTEEFGVSGKTDYKGRGTAAENYRRFVTEELLPAIYTNTDIHNFASYTIAGFSLGALSAFDIAWHHADIFSRVGAFSGSFWWRSKDSTKKNPDKSRIAHKMVKDSKHKPALKFWFQAGTQDEKSDRNQNGIIDSIDDTTALIYELYKKGYEKRKDIQYVELIGGKHDVPTWGKIMPEFLLWAFGR